MWKTDFGDKEHKNLKEDEYMSDEDDIEEHEFFQLTNDEIGDKEKELIDSEDDEILSEGS